MKRHTYVGDHPTEHILTVRPSFIGRLRFSSITGPDRNQVKDYLAEMFDYVLTQPEKNPCKT